MKTDVSPKIKAKVSKHVRKTYDCHGVYYRLGFYFYNVYGENDFTGKFLDTRKDVLRVPKVYDYVYCVDNGRHVTLEYYAKNISGKYLYEWQWAEMKRLNSYIKRGKDTQDYLERLDVMHQIYRDAQYYGVNEYYGNFRANILELIDNEREYERTNRTAKSKNSKSK